MPGAHQARGGQHVAVGGGFGLPGLPRDVLCECCGVEAGQMGWRQGSRRVQRQRSAGDARGRLDWTLRPAEERGAVTSCQFGCLCLWLASLGLGRRLHEYGPA